MKKEKNMNKDKVMTFRVSPKEYELIKKDVKKMDIKKQVRIFGKKY